MNQKEFPMEYANRKAQELSETLDQYTTFQIRVLMPLCYYFLWTIQRGRKFLLWISTMLEKIPNRT